MFLQWKVIAEFHILYHVFVTQLISLMDGLKRFRTQNDTRTQDVLSRKKLFTIVLLTYFLLRICALILTFVNLVIKKLKSFLWDIEKYFCSSYKAFFLHFAADAHTCSTNISPLLMTNSKVSLV